MEAGVPSAHTFISNRQRSLLLRLKQRPEFDTTYQGRVLAEAIALNSIQQNLLQLQTAVMQNQR